MSDETSSENSSLDNGSSFEYIHHDESIPPPDSQLSKQHSDEGNAPDHEELLNSSKNETSENSTPEQPEHVNEDQPQPNETLENSKEEEQLNATEEEPALGLSTDQTPNPEESFQFDHKQEEELKTQHELDEEEIPPTQLPSVDSTPLIESSTESQPVISDDRILTELEDPFGNHHHREEAEEQFSSIESSPEQVNNNPTIENEITEDHPLRNPTLSSFLPDLVDQIVEDHPTTETIPEQSDRNDEKSPSEFTSEDFPPLPPTAVPVHQIINDRDFPPLPSTTTTTKEEEVLLSTSIGQTELPPPMDVLGNKTLLKQTLVKGQANTRPTRSSLVTISYTLTLVDSLTSHSRVIEEIRNERYFVSENDLIPAIDICILLMDRGETSSIESDVRHCYGDQGCEEKHLPAVTTLNPYRMLIQLELHDWSTPLDIQLLSAEERLYWSEKKKLNGNFYYRRQDYKTSLQCYNGASRFLDLQFNPLDSSTDQSRVNVLIEKYVLVQNNVAQVYLLLNKYDDCLAAVERVLKFDSKNVKALFRQGKALFELGKYQEAIQALKTFAQIQKGNSAGNADLDKANELITISENKLANYQKSEREIYQRMFRPSTANNQPQSKAKDPKQTVQPSSNWLPYLALGAAAVAVIGYVAFTKYRKLS